MPAKMQAIQVGKQTQHNCCLVNSLETHEHMQALLLFTDDEATRTMADHCCIMAGALLKLQKALQDANTPLLSFYGRTCCCCCCTLH
jgi:hypothetical protein